MKQKQFSLIAWALAVLLVGCSTPQKSYPRTQAPAVPETKENVAVQIPEDKRDANSADPVHFLEVPAMTGSAELNFEVAVPAVLLDRMWQMSIYPEIQVLAKDGTVADTVKLGRILLSGDKLLAQQKRDNELADSLMAVAADSVNYQGGRTRREFIRRNMPEKEEGQTSGDISNWYSLDEMKAIDHYSYMPKIRQYRQMQKDAEALRNSPDTGAAIISAVISDPKGGFVCPFTETIATNPRLSQAIAYADGYIVDNYGTLLYTFPRTDTAVFQLRTSCQFMKEKERYIHKVIRRKTDANTAFNLDFKAGKSDIDPNMGKNAQGLADIRRTIAEVLGNENFQLDSIVVTAHCSPEGSRKANDGLSKKRSQSVCSHFDGIAKQLVDSVNALGTGRNLPTIRFVSRALAENWPLLDELIAKDSTITDKQKDNYAKKIAKVSDWDKREAQLRKQPYFKHVKDSLYPRLRVVNFNFRMGRTDMKKDTIMTTKIDTVYKKGVDFLRECEYAQALPFLEQYPDDYNYAACLVGLERYAEAIKLLEKNKKRDADINYLLALAHTRNGNSKAAVACYLEAVKQDPAMKEKAMQEPDMADLIKKHNLN
ncbi:MAG: hypothetical protein J6Y32_00510 [Bacteroidales bacterium]|nr:hypothetical protein [Bacteroidales bacterium]